MKPVWTDEQIIAQLTHWGGKWSNSGPVPFMFYSQSMAHHLHKTGFAPFSEAERQSLLQSMQLISDVANISFVNIPSTLQAPSKTNSFMGFYTIDDDSKIWGGYATRFIVDGTGPPQPMGRIYGADIVMNHDFTDGAGGWNLGDYNARLLMHELLHGLGLSHAGDYNIGTSTSYEVDATYFQDSTQYTVMSYWGASNTGANHKVGGSFQFASTPLLYDIAALHKLYGPNMTTRTGDTVYGFNNSSGRDAFDLARDPSAVFTIWDAGGIDTLDLSGFASASRVDLREGAFSDAGGMTLNISIAYGAVIENAIGGAGNDEIQGNSADNVLHGGSGDDILIGGAGDDILLGGAGFDNLSGGPGNDQLSAGDGGGLLQGGAGSDTITVSSPSGAGKFTIDAGDGNDTVLIKQLAGSASIALGAGSDLLVLAQDHFAYIGTGSITISDFQTGATGDRLDIASFLAKATSWDQASNPFYGGFLKLVQSGSNTLLQIDRDGKGSVYGSAALITFHNAVATSFTAENLGGYTSGSRLQLSAVGARGDFNGDGRDDILWRNVDGTVGNWLSTAGGATQYNAAAGLMPAPVDWHIVGIGDLNGDGRADILWRNDDGRVGNWLANAGGGFEYNAAAGLSEASADWKIVGIADLNGDGRDDILWRNDDGRVGNWLSTASGATQYNAAAGLMPASTDWHIVGIGDLNGDGRDDILWRNDDGTVGNWLANAGGGLEYNAAAGLSAASADWKIVRIADLNGDGRDDIVWRNDNGDVGNWLSSASGATEYNAAAGLMPAPTDWMIEPLHNDAGVFLF